MANNFSQDNSQRPAVPPCVRLLRLPADEHQRRGASQVGVKGGRRKDCGRHLWLQGGVHFSSPMPDIEGFKRVSW